MRCMYQASEFDTLTEVLITFIWLDSFEIVVKMSTFLWPCFSMNTIRSDHSTSRICKYAKLPIFCNSIVANRWIFNLL